MVITLTLAGPGSTLGVRSCPRGTRSPDLPENYDRRGTGAFITRRMIMTARPGSRATRRLVCVLASAVTLGACAGAMQTRPEDIPSLEAETAQNATPDALTRLGTAYYQAGRYADA